MRLHDEKPSVVDRPASLAVDLVIWGPRDRDEQPLIKLLQQYGLGERSQTVVWLDKFTMRLSMWRRRYLAELTEAEWREAAKELAAFLLAVHEHYRPRAIDYDTRAFSVGLHRAAKKQRKPVSAVRDAPLPGSSPVFWELLF
jgi:hypothetical protein